MNKSLGFAAAEYGLGAGAFFWSYILFQVPSNVMLARIGARRWIATIMLAWGLCSGATALVTGITSFVIVRFMLGVAEAGYFSGVIFFMTRWFPDRHRVHGDGRILRLRRAGRLHRFTHLGQHPGAAWVARIAGLAMDLPARGRARSRARGIRSIRAVRPAGRRTLAHARREGLAAGQAPAEQREAVGSTTGTLQALRSPCVVLLTIAYLCIGFGVYANVFFLPLIIKDMGFSNIVISYLAAVPAALGAIGMIVVSRSSDRTGERVSHVTVPTLVAALGLIAAGLTVGRPVAELISLCVVGMAISSALPTFWNLPTAYLGAGAAAAGIATINSVGNISGYLAPQLVGVLRDLTGTYAVAMLVVGGMVLVAAALLPLGAAARLSALETRPARV